MLNLKQTIVRLARHRAKWDMLMRAAGDDPRADAEAVGVALEEVRVFGSNPGNLRMFRYLPPTLRPQSALVVVLHGCMQSAASYNHGAGWSALADRHGFALLLPEQPRSNNPKGCFNWFLTGDTRRGCGEALSIRQMVERMVSEHGIDRRRVFVTGLSAGGAMTSVMLACYPDVFAAGAIIAGLPFGAASNVQEAFESMFKCPMRDAPEWGDLVRRAAPHRGPWPRVSVWHGAADQTVIPANAREILRQWADVHGLPPAPSNREMVCGCQREAWADAAGVEVIESYTIPRMPHGAPLATGTGQGACGVAGPFLIDVGISSSYHIAKFFGIVEAEAFRPVSSDQVLATFVREPPQSNKTAGTSVQPHVLEGEVLEKETDPRPDAPFSTTGAIDIGAVITKALKAAGLMRHS